MASDSPLPPRGILCLGSGLETELGDVMKQRLAGLIGALAVIACTAPTVAQDQAQMEEAQVQVQYLEIVTPEVDATCAALAAQHGVTFSDPVAMLGNARTAALTGGGRISVRAPMRADEAPVVRPYLLVDDIEAAIAAAQAAGAEFAMLATPIPGEGTFAIYMLGGIEHGIWQD